VYIADGAVAGPEIQVLLQLPRLLRSSLGLLANGDAGTAPLLELLLELIDEWVWPLLGELVYRVLAEIAAGFPWLALNTLPIAVKLPVEYNTPALLPTNEPAGLEPLCPCCRCSCTAREEPWPL
jgi:hypothetical protein